MASGVTTTRKRTAPCHDARFPILIVMPAGKDNTHRDKNQEPEIRIQTNRKHNNGEERVLKMAEKHWVIIDIGGERFQTQKEIFLAFPSTRLGKLMNADNVEEILQYCEEYTPGNPPEYFFDRNPETFPGILDMYRTGNFHIPEGGKSCAFVMRRDIIYWGLDELDMEACCTLKYYPEIEVCRLQKEGDMEQNIKEQKEAENSDFGDGKLAKTRTLIWEALEKPWTSNFAKHYACFSFFMVVISTVTFVISTSEEIQVSHISNINSNCQGVGGNNKHT